LSKRTNRQKRGSIIIFKADGNPPFYFPSDQLFDVVLSGPEGETGMMQGIDGLTKILW
jgi:hypothetical protein